MRFYVEPSIKSISRVDISTGETVSSLSGGVKPQSITITLPLSGMTGDYNRFIGSDVDGRGQRMILYPVYQSGIDLDPAIDGYTEAYHGISWVAAIDIKNKQTEIVQTHWIGERGGFFDDTAIINERAWVFTITSIDPADDGSEIVIKAGGIESDFDRKINDARMLGLDYYLSLSETPPEDDGRVTVLHSIDFVPNGSFAVHAMVRVDSYDGGINMLVCKGGNTTAEWALFITSAQTLRFRMTDSGGTSIAAIHSTTMNTGIIYHVVGFWDGSNLYAVLNGDFGPAQPFTNPYAGLTGDINFGTPYLQTAAHLSGGIFTVRIYNDFATVPSQKEISDETYKYASDTDGLVAEWKITEKGSSTLFNEIDPDLHPATLSNVSVPSWDPLVYSNTGRASDAGKLWNMPMGYVTVAPIWGPTLAERIAHICNPNIPYGTTSLSDFNIWVSMIDWIKSDGQSLDIDWVGADGPHLISWGTRGSGYIKFEGNQGPDFIPPIAFTHSIPGTQITVSGTGAIDNTYIVADVVREYKNTYARIIEVDPSTPITVSGSGTGSFSRVSPGNVSWQSNGVLRFNVTPTGRVLVRAWFKFYWERASAPSVALPIGESMYYLIQEVMGLIWTSESRLPYVGINIPVGDDWTDMTVSEALLRLARYTGIATSYYYSLDGLDVSTILPPDPLDTIDLTITKNQIRSIRQVRDAGPFYRFVCRFSPNSQYYTEINPIAQTTIGQREYESITSPHREVISTENTQSDISDTLDRDTVYETALIDKADAIKSAAASADLLLSGYHMYEIKLGHIAGALRPRRSQIYITDDRFPLLETGALLRVVGKGIDGPHIVIFAIIKKGTQDG